MLTVRWTFPCLVMMYVSALAVQSIASDTGYITYIPGNISIILTSPHGGRLRPANIPDRDEGCWDPASQRCVFVHDCHKTRQDPWRCWVINGGDGDTNNLTYWMSDAIYDLTGRRPYVIINELHRIKLDANRLADQAAFGDPIALSAWEEWHRYINHAKASLGGPGVLFDVHAHDHLEGNVELGYLISGPNLDTNQLDQNSSSIRRLASRTKVSFQDLLRGPQSVGTFLSAEGYRTVPSVSQPGPNGAPFFYGGTDGTNTATHGSRDGGLVDAIQLESPAFLVMHPNVTKVIEYARALARSIVRFHRLYYKDEGITDNDGGLGNAAITEINLCSRPLHNLGLLHACLFCPGSTYCDRKQWSGEYQFNKEFFSQNIFPGN